jgi:hypothetical protein
MGRMSNQGISPEEIVKAAGRHGLTVSDAQLHRWQRQGLIPRPKIQGLGRGRGTASYYPADTAQHIIALCELLAEDRRLDLAALALFFQGYPVRVERLKSILMVAADQWETEVGNLVNGTGITSKGADALDKMVFERLKPSPVTWARGHLRKSKFETFIRILIFVGAGRKPDFLEETEESAILKKGLGIGTALRTWLRVDDDELRSFIGSVATHFNQAALHMTIQETGDDELNRSKTELLIVWQTLMDLKACFLLLDEKYALGLGRLPDINFTRSSTLVPMMLLIWMHLRTMPEIAENIPHMIASATEVSSLRNLLASHPKLLKPMKAALGLLATS